METEKKFEPWFTPQFKDLELPARAAYKRLYEIDKELSQLPKDGGLRFQLSPPGTPPNYNRYGKREAQLNERKTVLSESFKKRAELEKELQKVDKVTAKRLDQAIDVHIGENVLRYATAKEINAIHKEEHQEDVAADYMDLAITTYRTKFYYDSQNRVKKEKDKSIEPDKD